jgi:poly(A) polymerase
MNKKAVEALEAGAMRVCATLRERGHRALFAGGCVRDYLLGEAPKDYDIATDASASEVVVLFGKTVDVGAAFGVTLVMEAEGAYEVSTFRKDGPYIDGRHPSSVAFVDEIEDAQRRDFTVNALFMDPESGEVLDYVSGRADLEKGILRAVGDPEARFREDHLRLLRAVRFAARLGFDIEESTFRAIRKLAHLIVETSWERIRDEVIKILTDGHAFRGFNLLEESGLLPHILPEVSAMKCVEQPPNFHPEGDVFVHTLLLLKHMRNPSAELALGALLHDVGKPLTQTFEDRIRFNNHEKVGARLAETICSRFRMSNDETEKVSWLVEQHMRLNGIPEMRESKRKRFVREEHFEELLELCRLDCLASHGQLQTIEWVKDYAQNLQPDEVRPALLLTGHDLRAMGYAPGPLFKTILTALEDAQLEGVIKDQESARAFVAAHWPRP